jgi:predicted outer membrane repeat protein
MFMPHLKACVETRVSPLPSFKHSNDFFNNVAQSEDNRAPRYGGAIAAEGNTVVTICG